MITFRLAEHAIRPDVQVVEVFDGERFVATITPGDPDSALQLRVTSKHLLSVNISRQFPAVAIVNLGAAE